MGEELKANTKILFVVLKNKEKVLVPGKIISKNKTHSDWYNVESNDGKYTDLLKMGKSAVFGKTFELPVHENKLQESKLTSIIRKMIKEEIGDLKPKKVKLWYIGKRTNPQLSKPYYVAYGQLSKNAAKQAEKTVYGGMYLTSYETKEEYDMQIEKLKQDGFTVNRR